MNGKGYARNALLTGAGVLAGPSGAAAAKASGSGQYSIGSGAPDPLSAMSLLQFGFGLLVVIGMIFLLAWVMRRMNRVQGTVQGQIKILGGLPLGSRERAVLVQVGEEQILLGVAPGRVSRLHVMKQPIDIRSSHPSAPGKGGFAARLAAAMQGGRKS
ncbi:flagellar biosynthetic protein FliO [Acidihalobacter ferrooxydans]|uniref:Flagellar protein n=1 Tax=Acidihalobacter ferrooxydans TaxID=1765967 RepID=A0A1P8UGM9_9GAMM|nr:flagellar biosynthetic protein FliO [Acidihalobacter ferrooxydans]APZ43018.1 flagellar biosynthetic protein FliO [Acidihalobacter ferrooxydans]